MNNKLRHIPNGLFFAIWISLVWGTGIHAADFSGRFCRWFGITRAQPYRHLNEIDGIKQVEYLRNGIKIVVDAEEMFGPKNQPNYFERITQMLNFLKAYHPRNVEFAGLGASSEGMWNDLHFLALSRTLLGDGSYILWCPDQHFNFSLMLKRGWWPAKPAYYLLPDKILKQMQKEAASFYSSEPSKEINLIYRELSDEMKRRWLFF